MSADNSLQPGPATSADRIEAIDTLRGFALLGILVMNIVMMAMPPAAYFSPLAYGEPTALNYGTWAFAHLFFDLKMLGIFSMLFGAGVVLMAERAQARGESFGRIHYRRTFWLLVIGLIHAYLIWHGDILVTYALCGLVLYLFRNCRPRTLVIWGVAVLLLGSALSAGGGMALSALRDVNVEIQAKLEAGQPLTEHRQSLIDQWNDVRRSFQPTADESQAVVDSMRGGLGQVLAANAHESIGMHLQAVPFVLFWRALALMLLGMAMMKSGVLTGERSGRFYRRWVTWGLALGLPLIAFGIWQSDRNQHDFVARWLIDGQYNHFGSVLISMAYVGMIMLICRSGRMPSLRRRLAAVGRTALSNYLLQSLIGVSLFYGYGLGLFGQVDRFGLWAFVLVIWAIQLVASPWWLSRYRFGPVEWLWRSLTYGRIQVLSRSRVGT